MEGWELFGSLLMIILILIITYFATVFIAKHGGGYGKSSYMQVIDRLSIDRNTTLVIVKIVDEYQVLVVGPNKIENLGVVDGISGETPQAKDFTSFLSKYFKKEAENHEKGE